MTKIIFWNWTCSRYGPEPGHGIIVKSRTTGGECSECEFRAATAKEVLTAEAHGALFKNITHASEATREQWETLLRARTIVHR